MLPKTEASTRRFMRFVGSHRRAVGVAAAVGFAELLLWPGVSPADGQEVPPGAELIMSDWILGSFLVFFCSGLIVFLIAARRGMFRNLEGAKYYLLTVEEKDYYTPDWAKEE